jgi:hypothetical protein
MNKFREHQTSNSASCSKSISCNEDRATFVIILPQHEIVENYKEINCMKDSIKGHAGSTTGD